MVSQQEETLGTLMPYPTLGWVGGLARGGDSSRTLPCSMLPMEAARSGGAATPCAAALCFMFIRSGILQAGEPSSIKVTFLL